MNPLASGAAGWAWDTARKHEYRYWSGDSWSERVLDAGQESTDSKLPSVAPYAVLASAPDLPLKRYRTGLIGRGPAYVDIGQNFAAIGNDPVLHRLYPWMRLTDKRPLYYVLADESELRASGNQVILYNGGQRKRLRLGMKPGLLEDLAAAGFTEIAST